MVFVGLAGGFTLGGAVAAILPRGSFWALVAATVAFHGSVLVQLPYFFRLHGMSLAEGWGLNRAGLRRSLIRGALAGIAALPISYGLQAACETLLRRLGIGSSPQDAIELLTGAGPWWQKAYLGVFAVVIAPVAEESLFRGLLLPVLQWRFGAPAAVAVTATLFGAMHANKAAFLPLAAFGAWLAFLRLRTGTLAAPVAAHSVFNLAPFVLLMLGVDLS